MTEIYDQDLGKLNALAVRLSNDRQQFGKLMDELGTLMSSIAPGFPSAQQSELFTQVLFARAAGPRGVRPLDSADWDAAYQAAAGHVAPCAADPGVLEAVTAALTRRAEVFSGIERFQRQYEQGIRRWVRWRGGLEGAGSEHVVKAVLGQLGPQEALAQLDHTRAVPQIHERLKQAWEAEGELARKAFDLKLTDDPVALALALSTGDQGRNELRGRIYAASGECARRFREAAARRNPGPEVPFPVLFGVLTLALAVLVLGFFAPPVMTAAGWLACAAAAAFFALQVRKYRRLRREREADLKLPDGQIPWEELIVHARKPEAAAPKQATAPGPVTVKLSFTPRL